MKKVFLFTTLILFALVYLTKAEDNISVIIKAYPKQYIGSCPVIVTFKGKITSNRAGKVQYRFIRSDGALYPFKTIDFKTPGTKEVTTKWSLGGEKIKTYTGWMAIEVSYPKKVISNKAFFRIRCIKKTDLKIEVKNCPAIVQAGQNLDSLFQVVVKNDGATKIKDVAVDIILKENTNFKIPISYAKYSPYYADGVLLKGGREHISLNPNQIINVKLNGPNTIPKDVPTGTYYLCATVDAGNKVKEVNERNNYSCCKVYIKGKSLKKDVDKDGIDDNLEVQLLKRFRPFYRFTKGEHYPPTDPIYQIRYAQLLKGSWTEGFKKPGVEKRCAGGEDNHINPPSRLLYCLNGKLNLLKNPKKTNYYLNLNDSKRKDPGNGKKNDWDYAVPHAPGLFGHVVKSGKYIKIEYWQYFAYNGQDLHGADHEGDWATVQLWYDPKNDRLIKTCHWAHGKGFCFDLRKAIKIKKLTRPDLNFYLIRYLGPNYKKHPPEIKFSNKSRFPKNYQNNMVEFYVLKEKPKDLHIVVYIEKDAHEFWPFSYGSYQWANKHTGNGIFYLTAFWPEKINLGELTHPMPNPITDKFKYSKEIVLRYNGYWGAWHHAANNPPPGPALHCQWTFPANEYNIAEKIKKYCEH